MQAQYLRVLRKLEAAAVALETAVIAGANAYANGENPIVAKHYTAGNMERYGWAPLSPKYAAAKARQTVQIGGRGSGSLVLRTDAVRAIETMKRVRDAAVKDAKAHGYHPSVVAVIKRDHDKRINAYAVREAQGRAGARLTTARGPKHRDPLLFGASTPAASMLPLLVRTGRLRDAVTRVRHGIRRERDIAYITFAGLPEYAQYLEHGTAKMPRRSPVEPCALDAEEVQAAMQRHLDAVLGTGKADVAPSSTSIPGTARMA